LVRCMPVASQAGNQVTWNHSFFGEPEVFGHPQKPVHAKIDFFCFFPIPLKSQKLSS
jgi:hypothetical protein